ncbi:sulfatase [Jannaschia sp. EhC01]|nr:sulfatase [Jannaschia sp. EhC01]
MRFIAAALILHLVLIQPNHPGAMTWGALWVFPLELPAILLAMIALGDSRLTRWVRAALTLVLTVIVVLKTADFVSFNALSRGFNPVADLPLIEALIRLLSGTLGPILTGLVLVGGVLAAGVVAGLIWWATGVWSRLKLRTLGTGVAAVAVVLATGLVIGEVGQTMGRWTLPMTPPGTAFTARVGVERVDLARRTLAELRTFREDVSNDPFTDTEGLFTAVDRDVLIIFVESYGRTSHDTPYYAELHRATLAAYGTRLRDLGLGVQSGFLGSPTHGGQSWLAHSTVSNGMWIDNQVSYRAALASGRETLFHHAANAGLRTAAVMPQITLDWPEAAFMGFEEIVAFEDIGYAGLPFNWVTMPDQFTLSAMDRLLRDGSDPRHLFAQVALISSHAPWVPVPQILPWEDIGDGTVFNEVAASGDTPEVVWRDRERVRFQYRLAVDYALQAVFEYAILHAEDPPLMVVIGDHQAASFIGLDERREVPVHVIGPEHLVAALSEIAPGGGLLPGEETPVVPMDAVRDIVIQAFADAPHQRGAE